MPSEIAISPTISQVYGAFDEASHCVFRLAMAKSCGGILRVGDLLAALCQLERPGGAELLPPDWRRTEPVQDDHRRGWQAPMSNEPALRNWLFDAYQLALEQSADRQGVLTPRLLWVVAFAQRLVSSSLPLSAICARLGVVCSLRLAQWHAPQRVPATAAANPEVPTATTELGRQLEQVLNEWLGLQSLPPAAERTATRERLAEGVRRIEALRPA